MKKVKIILISCAIFITTLVTGSYFFIKSKLRPEAVKQIIIENVAKTLPGSSVTLGEVDIAIGLTSKISLKNFSLETKAKKQPLFKVENFSVRVPFWAIISSSGRIEVVVENPITNYLEGGDEIHPSSNWSEALGSSGPAQPVDQKTIETKASEGQPASGDELDSSVVEYLKKASVDFSVAHLDVHYGLRDGQKGNIKIEKFLIKNLNFESNTAFELASTFDLKLPAKESATLELLVIGQFNLPEILLKKNIKSKVLVTVKNLTLKNANLKVAEIKQELDINISPESVINASFNINLGGSTITGNVEGKSPDLQLKKFKGDLILEEIAGLAGLSLPNISLGKSHFTFEGSIDLKPKAIKPEIKFGLTDPITFKNDLVTAGIGFNGTFKNTKYYLESTVQTFGGKINSTINGAIDINNIPPSISDYPSFLMNVNATGMGIKKQVLQEIIYGNGSEPANSNTNENSNKASSQNQEENKVVEKPIDLPRGTIVLKVDNFMIDIFPFNFDGKVTVGGSQVDTKNMVLKYSNGRMVSSFNVNLVTSNDVKGKFSNDLTDINLKGFSPFLPKLVGGVSGIFSGKINGDFKMGKTLEYKANVDVNAKNGEITGINIKEKVMALGFKIPQIKEKIQNSNLAFDQNFETLLFAGELSEKVYKMNNFNFQGVSNKLIIKANGTVYTPETNKEGEVMATLTDNTGKLSSILESNFGTKDLPMKLKGVGFTLMPDYLYTTERLAKGFVKTKGKEIVKKQAEKQLKKVIEEKVNNEQVGKFLKGLFKK